MSLLTCRSGPVCGDAAAVALAARLTQGKANVDRGVGARPIWLKVTLVPETVACALGCRLKAWTSWPVLAVLTLVGGIGYAILFTAGMGPAVVSKNLPCVFGLLLLTAVWHELGHAAALMRGGYPSGSIGAGLLFVIPVLWADVSAVAALPRCDRLRVDLAGMAFQLAAGGLLAVAAVLGTGPSSTLPAGVLAGTAWAVLLTTGWSLFPFVRSDGYWVLTDMLDVDALERLPSGRTERPLRAALAAYRVANLLFLVAMAVLLPLRLTHLAQFLAVHFGVPPENAFWRATALLLGAVLLGIIWTGAARRARALMWPRV